MKILKLAGGRGGGGAPRPSCGSRAMLWWGTRGLSIWKLFDFSNLKPIKTAPKLRKYKTNNSLISQPFLAHLIRRLMGELKVYQSLRRPSVCTPQKPLGQLNSNFIWNEEAGTKVCSNCPGHMTKMAATSIYGKNPLKIFSRTRRPMTLGLVMGLLGLPSLFK